MGAWAESATTVAWDCMFHRNSTWWRALVVAVLGLATMTWPSPVSAASSANFLVVHQSVTTTLPHQGVGTFTISLRLINAGSSGARVTLTLYPALVDRATLDSVTNGAGVSTTPLAASTQPLSCLHHDVTTFTLTIYTVRHVAPYGPCAGTRPELHLRCSSAGCDGVYPLRYQVRLGGVLSTKWSLVAIVQRRVAQPLRVALVTTFGPDAANHPARSTGVLRALAHAADAPLALATDYRFLNAINEVPATNLLRRAFVSSLSSSQHVVVNAPPSTIDFAGLAANGFSTQVNEQLSLTDNLLASLTGRYSAGPVLLSSSPSTASALALTHAGVSDLLVPESSLATPPSETLNWGAPFHLPGLSSVTALTNDGPLSTLSGDAGIEPGRRVALALATLAFLHFEEPNAPSPRTVVIDLSANATSGAFVGAFIAGLASDPVARLTSLPPLFDNSLVATNGAPATRALVPTTGLHRWSSHNVSALALLIGDVNSYAPSISSQLMRTQLRVAVAQTEILGSAAARSDAIASANALFNQQLQNFSIDPSAITLAGPGTSLPITVISHAGYPVTGVVHLVTPGLTFTKGNAIAIAMTSPTNTVRVATQATSGSSLTLQVILTTPNNQVVLARAAIQVRVAGTSVVGYLLTLASLFVLGLWWYRTNRRRSKGRHAK